jgi:hypothetical protein
MSFKESTPHVEIPTINCRYPRFFYFECPICRIYKFRTFNRKVIHAHEVVCSAVAELYTKAVVLPNQNRVKRIQRRLNPKFVF